MKYFVISDNTDTQVGMRLAGVDGVVARTREEGLTAIDMALSDSTIGILLITESLAGLCADRLDPVKVGGAGPLVVEIPDRDGGRRKDSITRYVREAIGVKL